MREKLTADPGTCGISDAAHEGRNGHHASGVGGICFRRYGGVEGGLNDDFTESYDSDGDGDGDGASGETELHVSGKVEQSSQEELGHDFDIKFREQGDKGNLKSQDHETVERINRTEGFAADADGGGGKDGHGGIKLRGKQHKE